MMGKSIVLELDGDWESGFRTTLEIRSDETLSIGRAKANLPPAPDLGQQLQQYWQEFRELGAPSRIKSKRIIRQGSINERVRSCKKAGQQMRDRFNTWFESESFRKITDRLHRELQGDADIRFSVRVGNEELQKFPWGEWNLFQGLDRIEPTLSPLELSPGCSIRRQGFHPNVKILAILGHSEDIDIDRDRAIIEGLPHVDPTFLIEPKSSEINDHLWDREWDIIFFAGHSETEDDTGRIYLNAEESITINELWCGLKKAVEKGLQLAIFNSCDGLGLARKINDPLIPFVIVMREAVPDRVAQAYLRHFLTAFAGGETLHAAAREARERLQGIRFFAGDRDFECPGATWLPVIYENPAATPPRWQDLYHLEAPHPPKSTSLKGWKVARVSLVCMMLVMVIRSLGLLQPLELSAYDRLMEQRSPEGIDSRILVVEITQSDTNRYEYPLPDSILAQLIQKLEGFQPSVIGLDLHRYQARKTGREELIARFQNNPNLFLACGFNSQDKNHAPPPEFTPEQRKQQMGFSDLIFDGKDQQKIVRRQWLSYSPDLAENSSACTTPYSLSFQLAHRYLAQNLLPTFTRNEEIGAWQVGDRVFKPLSQRFGGYQNLQRSTQIMLNYRSGKPAQSVTLEEVLSGKVERDRVEGKVVLIGNSSYFSPHRLLTPYGEMFEIWVQAHLTSQLLSSAIENRPSIWVLPQWGAFQWGDSLWTFAWSLLGGILTWTLRKRPLYLGLSIGAVLGLLYYLCLTALKAGGWLPLLPSAFALLLAASLLALNFSILPLSKNLK